MKLERLPFSIGVIEMYYNGWVKNEQTRVTIIEKVDEKDVNTDNEDEYKDDDD